MPNEIELKLSIKPADIPRLRRHPALRRYLADKPVTRHLVSTYFDTPDLQLLHNAISLRVRRMSGGWFQAVKAAGHSLAGLHQRMEWEDIIAGAAPDFTKITEPGLARLFDDQRLRDSLKPIFVTDVQRTEWQLQYEDGSEVEVALDVGEVQANGKTEAIEEIELELKHGNALYLFELALALQADIPLHIENVSKAQRGYAYYLAQPRAISKAKDITLHPRTSVDEAFREIGGECLRHLQSNQDMVLHGDDAEGVHQMRVALRQLDSAARLFKRKSSTVELSWITAALGKARNWDVMLNETLPAAAEQLPQDQFDTVRLACIAEQKRAYARLRTALRSQRYQRLLLSLGACLQEAHSKEKVGKFAGHALQRLFKKLQCCDHDLSQLDAHHRHRIRIKSKRLRYATEFFASLYEGKKHAAEVQAWSEHLGDLQKYLGKLNDIAATESMLRQLTGKLVNEPELMTRIISWNTQRARKLLKQADKSWRALCRTKPYWD